VLAARGEAQARTHLAAARRAEAQIRIIEKEVPAYVSAKTDRGCTVSWGVVRLLDAAANGNDPAWLRDRIAPGQPDDAASDVSLSEMVALLAGNLGAARLNALQLEHLQAAVAQE